MPNDIWVIITILEIQMVVVQVSTLNKLNFALHCNAFLMPCMTVERYSVVMYMPKSRIDCLVVQQYS